ncbi:MAG: pro-sigmaK processing inhibitor BofA family protein [Phascolarctobacterium sp.]|nr:pro-sigmaK processing inhibitor BofA family protein [Phascolarctobacterium sp.]
MEMFASISEGGGLSAFVSLGTMVVAVLVLFLVVKFFSLSLSLVWNGIIGVLFLWGMNLVGVVFGFTVDITIIKALIAGFFGIPGLIAIIAYELL